MFLASASRFHPSEPILHFLWRQYSIPLLLPIGRRSSPYGVREHRHQEECRPESNGQLYLQSVYQSPVLQSQ